MQLLTSPHAETSSRTCPPYQWVCVEVLRQLCSTELSHLHYCLPKSSLQFCGFREIWDRKVDAVVDASSGYHHWLWPLPARKNLLFKGLLLSSGCTWLCPLAQPMAQLHWQPVEISCLNSCNQHQQWYQYQDYHRRYHQSGQVLWPNPPIYWMSAMHC